MDAEQSHWFCTPSSSMSPVGHQFHHLMDELPMPCPTLVPDFTSLQGPAQQSHKLLMRGLAEMLLQTQGRVGAGGRSALQGCAKAVASSLQCGNRAAHPTSPPQLRAGTAPAVCGGGFMGSHELSHPTADNTGLCTGSFAANQTELRLKGYRAPVLALLVPTAACPAPLNR